MNKGDCLDNQKQLIDLTRLLCLGDKNYGFMAGLSASTGMHLEDVLELTVQDLSASYVYIRQETGELKYPVPTYTIQNIIQPLIVGKNLDERGFVKPTGEAYVIEEVNIELENAAKHVGIQNFGPETLRKWYFYNVWKHAKENIEIVQKVCGFETKESAAEYIGVELKKGFRKLLNL